MIDNTKVNHVEEQIFGAISVIAEKVIQGLSFDRTLLCTIVNDDKRKDGEYQVSDGTKEFTAYSSQTDYKKDQAVYVTIPNGDINQQKMIIGKYKSDEATPSSVTSPFDLYVPIKLPEIETDYSKEKGLKANDTKKEEEILKETVLEDIIGYTRLGLKAKFKSSVAEAVSGSYGLRVILTGTKADSNGTTIVTESFVAALTQDDMFGNPYNFESYYKQEKVFAIEQFTKITKIKIDFYQNKDFKNSKGEEIKLPTAENGELPIIFSPDLFIKDIELSFGIDSSEVQGEYLQIYSEIPLVYSEGTETELKSRLVVQNDNGDYGVEDLNTNQEIKWYKRDLSYSNSINDGGGLGWKLISDNNIVLNSESEEHYKAILFEDNKKKLESNILYFTNINRKMTESEKNSALKIICDDDSNGNYMIYRQGGALIDPSQRDSVRALKVEYLGTEIADANSLEWIFPKEKTMIDYNFGEDANGNKINIIKSSTVNYKIKNHYNIEDNNNTIMCKYTKILDEETKQVEVYTAVKTLQFGTQGTGGSEYTMVVGLASGENAITVDQTDSIVLRIYDSNNNKILLDGAKFSISSLDIFNTPVYHDNKYAVRWELKKGIGFDQAQILTITANTLNLTTYYPLAIRSSSNYKYISGPTQVIYSTSGEPNYSKEECILYNNSNESVEKLTTRPTIPSVYLSNNPQFIEFKDKWKQPILFIQNKYPSTTISQWDGENVKIDGGTVLGTSFAAGTKDSNNKFSGVMLGDWRGDSDLKDHTGIFGFKNGELVYSIRDDGDAYFKGEINATSGSVGGWIINSNSIQSQNRQITLESSGTISVNKLTIGDLSFGRHGDWWGFNSDKAGPIKFVGEDTMTFQALIDSVPYGFQIYGDIEYYINKGSSATIAETKGELVYSNLAVGNSLYVRNAIVLNQKGSGENSYGNINAMNKISNPKIGQLFFVI